MKVLTAPSRLIVLSAVAILILAAATLLVVIPRNAGAVHTLGPGVHVELLSPVTFPDQIDARFKVKLDGGNTQVIHVRDLDHVLNAKLTFDPGSQVPWHTHPGPAIVTVQAGSLTITNASDCVPRTYVEGQGFLDPGHGNVHKAVNDSGGVTVVQATFFEVPVIDGMPKPTILVDDPGC